MRNQFILSNHMDLEYSNTNVSSKQVKNKFIIIMILKFDNKNKI